MRLQSFRSDDVHVEFIAHAIAVSGAIMFLAGRSSDASAPPLQVVAQVAGTDCVGGQQVVVPQGRKRKRKAEEARNAESGE